MSADPNERSFQVPFVIGVPGHRDLRQEDVTKIEGCVQSILKDFQGRLPSTPLLLLSALAGGADQRVARVALRCGVQLAAILPMPKELYRSTLEVEAQPPFDELLLRAALVINLPLNGLTAEQLKESEETRARTYDSLGRFLATHCQALIALWDGVPSEKAGGTARVVQYILEGPPTAELSEGDPQTGIVYGIATPRASNPTPDGEPFQLRVLVSDGAGQDEKIEDFELLAQRLEAFNREAAMIGPAGIPAMGTLIPDRLPGP